MNDILYRVFMLMLGFLALVLVIGVLLLFLSSVPDESLSPVCEFGF